MDYDETDYAAVKMTEHNRISSEGQHLTPGGNWLGVQRQPSRLERLGDKILGTVRGRHSRSRSFLGKSGAGHDPEMGKQTGSYAKVEERDEDEPLGYDISTFGADFIPAPAVRAMEEHKMDADYVYTGELYSPPSGQNMRANGSGIGTGEAIDLSTFSGMSGADCKLWKS
jgi:hypothetical protein